MVSAIASTSARASGRRTWPAAPMRSSSTWRWWRAIRGSGSTRFRSYCSNRLSVRISITSRKPLVVISAVLAPRRSISALVARVVPWRTMVTSPGATPARAQTCPTASMMPSSGAAVVVSTLTEVSAAPASSTTSVKVPPISTPSLIGGLIWEVVMSRYRLATDVSSLRSGLEPKPRRLRPPLPLGGGTGGRLGARRQGAQRIAPELPKRAPPEGRPQNTRRKRLSAGTSSRTCPRR